MNRDLANACGGVLPLILRELEGTFLAKCKGPHVDSLSVEFQEFSDRWKEFWPEPMKLPVYIRRVYLQNALSQLRQVPRSLSKDMR